MNPEENNETAPFAGPTPETSEAPTPPPSLDQVAADLTSAAANNTLESTEPSAPVEPVTPAEPTISVEPTSLATPIEPVTSVEPTSPTAPVEPVAPAGPVTPESTPVESMTAPVEPTPVDALSGSADTAPNPVDIASTPVDTTSTPVDTPLTPDTPSLDSLNTTTSDFSVTPGLDPTLGTEASGASPMASEGLSVDSEASETSGTLETSETSETTIPPAGVGVEGEEPPLVPAEPVPGSIGSAISYSDSTPDHSTPTAKPKKLNSLSNTLKLSKENLRLVLIIGIGIVLVAVVVVVLIFIIHGSSSKKTTTPSANTNNSSQTVQPTISSLTCTKEGNKDVFPTYGEVISGKEEVVAMYSDDTLTSFGTNLHLEYDSEEAAQFGESAARSAYNNQLSASGLTTDPFESSYSNINNVVTATHQADGDDIDTSNARVLGFYVVRGGVVDDPDTLIDNYETDGYICVEK